MAEDAARAAKPEKRPPPIPPKKAEAIAKDELESLDDGPVLKDGRLWPSALPRPARRPGGPPPPPPGRRARGTEPLAPDNVTSGLIDVRAMAMAYAAEKERAEIAEAAPPPAEEIIKVEPPPPVPAQQAPAAEAPAPEPEAAPKPVMAEGTRPIPVVEEPAAEPVAAEDEREDKEARAALWLLVARRAAAVVLLGGVAALAVTLLVHRGRSDDDAAALPEEEAEAVRIEPEPAAAVAVAPAEAEVAPAEVAPAVAAEPVTEPVVIAQPTASTGMDKAEPTPAVATDEVIDSAAAETPQPALARAEEPAERAGPGAPPPELLADGCFDAACAATARQVRRPEPPAAAVITAPARLPTRPSNSEIASAIFAANDQIAGCGDVYGASGAVPLKLRIAASGAITSVAVGEGSTRFRTCVADIIRQLRMPASLIGTTASFPVLIR